MNDINAIFKSGWLYNSKCIHYGASHRAPNCIQLGERTARRTSDAHPPLPSVPHRPPTISSNEFQCVLCPTSPEHYHREIKNIFALLSQSSSVAAFTYLSRKFPIKSWLVFDGVVIASKTRAGLLLTDPRLRLPVKGERANMNVPLCSRVWEGRRIKNQSRNVLSCKLFSLPESRFHLIRDLLSQGTRRARVN